MIGIAINAGTKQIEGNSTSRIILSAQNVALPTIGKERRTMNEQIENQIHEFAVEMYKAGYENGTQERAKEKFQKGYECGLHDAWECAKKLAQNRTDKEWEELCSIFDVSKYQPHKIFERYSAIEAMAKIKEHEEKQKCKTCGNNDPNICGRCRCNNLYTDMVKHCSTCKWDWCNEADYDVHEKVKHCRGCKNKSGYEPYVKKEEIE